MAAKSLELKLIQKNRRLERQNASHQDNIRAINSARMNLERKKIELEELLQAVRADSTETIQAERAKNTLLNVENARLKQHNKDLEEEVRKERNRVSQSLDIAENASNASAYVARLAGSLGLTLQSLDATISNLDKERKR